MVARINSQEALVNAKILLQLIKHRVAGYKDGDSHVILADQLVLIHDSGVQLYSRLASIDDASQTQQNVALRKLRERLGRIFDPSNFVDNGGNPVDPNSANCHFRWPDNRGWESILTPAIKQLESAYENSQRQTDSTTESGALHLSDNESATPKPCAGFLNDDEIAKKYGLPLPRLKVALYRWRRENLCSSDWTEIESRKPREPKYLYLVIAVWPIIKRYLN